MVVAFKDENTYSVYTNTQSVPENLVTFNSPEELGKELSIEELDNIRKRLLQTEVEKAPSKEMAERMLWAALTAGYSDDPHPDVPSTTLMKVDRFGNRAHLTRKKRELVELIYIPGSDPMVDHFMKKIPRQGKAIINTLLADGQGIWSYDDAVKIIELSGLIKGVQGVKVVFGFYFSFFIHYKIIRRVSYLQFATDPKYKGRKLGVSR